jgi:putative cell wall-binding protein
MIIIFLENNVMNKKNKKQLNLISDKEYYEEIAPHFKDYNIMKRGTGKETLKEMDKKSFRKFRNDYSVNDLSEKFHNENISKQRNENR